MKIFISWSGEKSRRVGDLLDDWLQCVIQAVDPWMSSKDIDRGALWFSEITSQLQDTSLGIICLTKENVNKPWILFEAGALAKGLSSNRVCPVLIDLDPTDVKDPLAQFNYTIPSKEGIWDLVRTLNTYLGEKALKEKILEQVFQTYWPTFEVKFQSITNEIHQEVEIEERSEDDMLKELLSISRNMDKRIRNLEYSNKEKNSRKSNVSLNVKSSAAKDYVIKSLENGEHLDVMRETLLNVYDMSKENVDKILMTILLNRDDNNSENI